MRPPWVEGRRADHNRTRLTDFRALIPLAERDLGNRLTQRNVLQLSPYTEPLPQQRCYGHCHPIHHPPAGQQSCIRRCSSCNSHPSSLCKAGIPRAACFCNCLVRAATMINREHSRLYSNGRGKACMQPEMRLAALCADVAARLHLSAISQSRQPLRLGISGMRLTMWASVEIPPPLTLLPGAAHSMLLQSPGTSSPFPPAEPQVIL